MKISVQYVNDSVGNTQAVQIPMSDWEKVLSKLKKHENILKIKKKLTLAFKEIQLLEKSKKKQQTLKEFLDEL